MPTCSEEPLYYARLGSEATTAALQDAAQDLGDFEHGAVVNLVHACAGLVRNAT